MFLHYCSSGHESHNGPLVHWSIIIGREFAFPFVLPFLPALHQPPPSLSLSPILCFSRGILQLLPSLHHLSDNTTQPIVLQTTEKILLWFHPL